MIQEISISDFRKALLAYTAAIVFCSAATANFTILYLDISPNFYRMVLFLLFGMGFLAMTIEILKEIKSCLEESKQEDSQ